MNPYGYAPAGCVLRCRRAQELLPARRAARRDPAARPPAHPLRRDRGVAFEPFFPDEVVVAVPAGHRCAGRTVSLERLSTEPLIVMQEGAGVRQVIEDELRKAGTRLRDLDVQLELGLQESVRSAVLAGHGITFISRLAIQADLASGVIANARVRGLAPASEILLARASGS